MPVLPHVGHNLGPARCLVCPYILTEHYGTGADRCMECCIKEREAVLKWSP